MKSSLIGFILFVGGMFVVGCNGDDMRVIDENSVDLKMVEPPNTDELCKDVSSPNDGSGGGAVGKHWVCDSCCFANLSYHTNCISCTKKKPASSSSNNNNNNNPEISPDNNSQQQPNNNSNQNNYLIWYASDNAIKYFKELVYTSEYENDSDYANGVNMAWSGLVKRMKEYDTTQATQQLCQSFVSHNFPEKDGSCKKGFIDGINAALDAYNYNISKDMFLSLSLNEDLSGGIILFKLRGDDPIL